MLQLYAKNALVEGRLFDRMAFLTFFAPTHDIFNKKYWQWLGIVYLYNCDWARGGSSAG